MILKAQVTGVELDRFTPAGNKQKRIVRLYFPDAAGGLGQYDSIKIWSETLQLGEMVSVQIEGTAPEYVEATHA